LIDKFTSRIEKLHGEDACWEWTGPLNHSGYGRYYNSVRGKREGAHRASYRFHFGSFDESFEVLHQCDNPKCCRPDHLFLGTQADNMKDMAAKGRGTTGKSPWIKGRKASPESVAIRRPKLMKYIHIVTLPTGEVVMPISLNEFCKLNGLSAPAMYKVARREANSYKGYLVDRFPL